MVNEVIVLTLNGREYPIKFDVRALTRLYKENPAEAFTEMSNFEVLPLVIQAGANPADNPPTGQAMEEAMYDCDPHDLSRVFDAFQQALGFFLIATSPPVKGAASPKSKGKK